MKTMELCTKPYKITTCYHFKLTGIINNVDLSTVEIIFEDGKFVHCDYDFSCPYTREEWRLLEEINRLIEILEEDENRKNLKRSYGKNTP